MSIDEHKMNVIASETSFVEPLEGKYNFVIDNKVKQ